MSTNQPDSAIIHQDNVTSTPAVPVTKTQPEGTRKGGGRRVMTVHHSTGKRKKGLPSHPSFILLPEGL